MIDTTTYTTAEEIQAKYQRLYVILRKYIWGFDTVEAIANLEVSIYQKFPDKDSMLHNLELLNTQIKDTYNELASEDDTEFRESYDDLAFSIENYADIGCELYSVVEVIDTQDAEVDSDESTDNSDKHKFSIGNIIKEDDVLEEM